MVITEWTEGEPSDKVENLPISNQVEDHTHIRDPRPPNYELQEVAIAVKKKPPPLEPLVCPPTPNVNPPVLPSPVRPPDRRYTVNKHVEPTHTYIPHSARTCTDTFFE